MGENELTVPNDAVNFGDLEALAASALPAFPDPGIASTLSGGGGGFLPYLKLVQASSPLTMPPTSIASGSFALMQGKNAIPLGKALDIFMCHWRPKAMYSDKKNKSYRVAYDETSDIFKEFKQHSQAMNTGYFWGFEFLLYDGKTGKYMTLYCNNVTLRRAANEKLFQFMHKPCTLEPDFIDTDDHKWWGVKASPCTTPFEVAVDLNVMQQMISTFQDPDSFNPEEIEAEEVVGGRER
jgi:hypothetical protein